MSEAPGSNLKGDSQGPLIAGFLETVPLNHGLKMMGISLGCAVAKKEKQFLIPY